MSLTEDKETEIQPWMVEEPASVLAEKSAYGLLIHKWLYFRSKLPMPPIMVLPPAPKIRDENALIQPRCRTCDRKYRLCICDSCDFCGELEADCECEKCNDCHIRNDNSTCQYCGVGQMNFDEVQKLFCHCFCKDCGVRYSFDISRTPRATSDLMSVSANVL